jgi:hypothetical protein
MLRRNISTMVSRLHRDLRAVSQSNFLLVVIAPNTKSCVIICTAQGTAPTTSKLALM